MTDASSSANHVVRAALLKMSPDTVLATADSLDLRAHSKVSAVVGVPLRQLQSRRDVNAFATSAPIAAVKGLLEVMALAPLEKIIGLLGEHADSPNYEQLATAVDEMLATGSTNDEVVAVLAFAVSDAFPAAPQCRRLLAEREELALPELPDIAAPSVLAPPREVSAEIREQRKNRREEEKRRKKSASTARPQRTTRPKNVAPPRTDMSTAMSIAPKVPEARRHALLTPLEAARFDTEHPLAGTVLVVDVPFDAHDPEQPEITSKERPALVVAASNDALLVRAIYSNPSPTRSLFGPWRRVGLDHISYIDDVRVVVASERPEAMHRLTALSTAEWNTLF
ncbi:MAG TPA: hypothetical protein VG246_00790 [Acidimicrobiales bacterium]|nr:hypothetical protein [Acidimicrobiales bacterium]